MSKVKKKKIRELADLYRIKSAALVLKGIPPTINCFNAPAYKRGQADAYKEFEAELNKLAEDES